ncbi:MAG: hypothetical protein EOP62_07350 [Sphingomonadales bacterium]|nr:MAG: hypothetical protein EOP62_07350 [Sphingomonadales bacterium]
MRLLKKLCFATTALVLFAPPASSQEPETAPVPRAVTALKGCWKGSGEVMGKAVTIALTAGPIAHDALFVVDAASVASADPTDRYAAHLIFGGADKDPARITGFWADSFGGAYTATGSGQVRADGFEMVYPYPDNDFVNRWHITPGQLTWQIVARDAKGVEQPFASYTLRTAACG